MLPVSGTMLNEAIVFEGPREVGPTLYLVPLLLGHDNNNYSCEIMYNVDHIFIDLDKTDLNVMLCCHPSIP